MHSDQQIEKLIAGLDENDPVRKALTELLHQRRKDRYKILQLRESRDFFKRQTELDVSCV